MQRSVLVRVTTDDGVEGWGNVDPTPGYSVSPSPFVKHAVEDDRVEMEIDETKSISLYFGTTTGQLWIGRDDGEKWEGLFDALPPIHCVKVAVV